MQIKVNNRELKEVDHFKYFESVLTRDGYSTRENKMIIAIAKKRINRNISLLTSMLNIEVEILFRCYVWTLLIWLRDLETKINVVEVFGKF